ncbi:MAG: class I SAM-dependent methyltransferase [Chloroflexi bacterium]|nr:class I SAM-dependent methyltransferase [Chloroflexota bacterium]
MRDAWNTNAEHWNERMGEGNDFYNYLVRPSQDRLLGIKQDELVVEIACGNGNFTRHLAGLGARVIAADISERMVEIARQRTTLNADRIEYRVVDATDTGQLLALGERRFDAAVCNMAMMDMTDIKPLLSSLARMLKLDGRFVFTITHPCFNSTRTIARVTEYLERDGEEIVEHSVKMSEYIRSSMYQERAMAGMAALQFGFHRPIREVFNACFEAGFVMDGIEEPVFPESAFASRAPSERLDRWRTYAELPPVLAARLRLSPAAQ